MASATLNRQLAESALTPETIVKIARGYNEPAVPGLIAFGLLTESDIAEVSIEDALHRAEDEQLMDEVLRRMQGGSRAYDGPIVASEPLPGTEDVNVHRLTRTNQPSVIDEEDDILDLPYVAHEPDEGIEEDDDESRYDT
ncbi:hypothetical protein [Rhodococcus sp. 27YEA15]|uniref:hypothetical protein n=1 Tax=Rhodococcus sp. 27YEA15 TaxID=3156259 RepID=UPI003C7DB7F5